MHDKRGRKIDYSNWICLKEDQETDTVHLAFMFQKYLVVPAKDVRLSVTVPGELKGLEVSENSCTIHLNQTTLQAFDARLISAFESLKKSNSYFS